MRTWYNDLIHHEYPRDNEVVEGSRNNYRCFGIMHACILYFITTLKIYSTKITNAIKSLC